MCNMRMRTRDGFAMIDLLVTIILLFMVLTLAVPGCARRVRDAQYRSQTMNNMSQCAKAAHLAHDQFKEFPPYYGTYGAKDATPYTYHVHLLPYVDQQQLYSMAQPNRNAIVPAYLSTTDPSQSGNGAGAANFPVNLRLYYTKGGVGELSAPPNLIYPHAEVVLGWNVEHAAIRHQVPELRHGRFHVDGPRQQCTELAVCCDFWGQYAAVAARSKRGNV